MTDDPWNPFSCKFSRESSLKIHQKGLHSRYFCHDFLVVFATIHVLRDILSLSPCYICVLLRAASGSQYFVQNIQSPTMVKELLKLFISMECLCFSLQSRA